MPAKNELPTYDSISRSTITCIILLVAIGLFFIFSGNGTPVGDIMLALAAIASLYVYVLQAKYLCKLKQGARLISQVFAFVVALFVPFIALTAGDLKGASAYGTPSNGSGDFGGLIIGAFVAFVWIIGCVAANEVHINRKTTSQVRRITGKVFYVLGFFIIAAVSWLTYGLAYSLHDPNTE